jgi:centrosomal protein CEP135
MSRKSLKSNSAHFLALRRRLDAMGYTDYPLGLDSAPLAQIMLEDLVATTEALRDMEENSDGVINRLKIAEQLVEPLQEENLKLRRDNTQLHQEMIAVGEESLKVQNQYASTSFALQAENRRLALAKQQSDENVDLLKSELTRTKLQLAQALEPSSSRVSKSPSDSKSKKRSSRDSRSNLSDSSIRSLMASTQSLGESVPQTEYELLQVESDNQKRQINDLTSTVEGLKGSIKLRDDEIQRLGEELQKETGRDGYLISLRYKYQKSQEEIEKLRTQIRLINPNAYQSIEKKRKERKGKKRLVISKSKGYDAALTEEQEKQEQSTPTKEQDLRKLEDKNKNLMEMLDHKDSIIAEMAANFAFIGDNLNSALIKSSEKNISIDIGAIEKKMNDMKEYYEKEIERLSNQINSHQIVSENTEIAKMIANTKGMDVSFREDQSEVQELKKRLAEAEAKISNSSDSGSVIIQQLRKEHSAMKKEIEDKTKEIERLRKELKHKC